MKCSNCKKRDPKPNRKLCKVCSDSLVASTKRQNKSLREQGLCIACREPSNGCLRCSKCALKNALGRSNLNATIDDLFQLLEDQKHCCAYTGLAIQAGVNAAVDHKQPKSKGGSGELQNLHWVESNINKLKGNMLHDEFIDYLRHLKVALNNNQ